MIDLHMHSNHSDGTDDIVDVLKKAEKIGLSCISITDHNTCSEYKELRNMDVKKYYTGKIIPGIELNTAALGVPIELLGYGIDIDKMEENLKGVYLTPEERNMLEIERLYKKCLEAGIKLDDDFISSYTPDKYASQHLHQALTKNEENKKIIDEESWNDSIALYRKYMSNPESLFYIDMNDILPSIDKVVEMVKTAGGKVFIPHIFEYKEYSMDILKHLLDNYPIDGIECYYSRFTKDQTERMLKLCDKMGLLVSGGSDYHGEYNKGVEMGTGRGNLSIDDSIIDNWTGILEFEPSKRKF